MPQFSAKTKDLRETSKHGCDRTAILPLDLFSLFNIHKIEERHLSEAGFTTAFPKLGRKIFCCNVEDLYKMCWAVKSPSALKWSGLKTTLQNSSSCSTIQIQQQQNNCRKHEIRKSPPFRPKHTDMLRCVTDGSDFVSHADIFVCDVKPLWVVRSSCPLRFFMNYNM